jgi:hypothetical protein
MLFPYLEMIILLLKLFLPFLVVSYVGLVCLVELVPGS